MKKDITTSQVEAQIPPVALQSDYRQVQLSKDLFVPKLRDRKQMRFYRNEYYDTFKSQDFGRKYSASKEREMAKKKPKLRAPSGRPANARNEP